MANSEDPDKTPRSVASNLDLHSQSLHCSLKSVRKPSVNSVYCFLNYSIFNKRKLFILLSYLKYIFSDIDRMSCTYIEFHSEQT